MFFFFFAFQNIKRLTEVMIAALVADLHGNSPDVTALTK